MDADLHVGPKWIVWRSLHRSSALARYVDAASVAGAEGIFIEPEKGGSRVGCLNPERSEDT